MTWGDLHGGFLGQTGRLRLRRKPSAGRWGAFSLIVAIVAALLVAVVQPARAGVGLGVTPTFPGPVTVGQTGVPASLQIVNTSTTPDDVDPIVIQSVAPGLPAISLVPSCGTPFGAGTGDCPIPDPGVFSINSPAFGEAGTACEGVTFTVTVLDPATGKVAFIPDMAFALDPPGSPNDTCRINFTYNVLKRPTIDSQPGVPGSQTSQIGFASGINEVTNTPGSGVGASNITVLAAAATIVTSATPQVTIGSPISDTATVTGVPAGPTPTGTVTFTLFGPDNPTCTGAPIFAPAPVPLVAGAPPTATANSGDFTPAAIGTYNWVAVYSGDINYNAATSPCGAPNESSVVAAAQATIVTAATTPVVLGNPISDTATVTGAAAPAPQPTGTVTFTLFGPGNPTCTGAPIFTSTNPLIPGAPPTATATSGDFTPTAVGTYNWVAVYSGDAAYDPVTSPCGAPNEASVVTEATPTIVTTATPTATVGSPISDTATVTGTGGPTPTGTVTFTLFGPGNPTCTGAPIFTSTNPLIPGAPPTATATSGDFTPTAVGTYNWVAVYSGDSNYTPATSPCGAPNEASIVSRAPATIVTSATPVVTIGSPISDTATVTGIPAGPTPTGTVIFTLFGPANPTCTGAPIFTSAAIPLVPGAPPTATANSGNFTPTAVGTYNWVAVYSGDATYDGATSPCGAPNESSVVNTAVATIVTSATTPVTIGSPISDTATVTGAVAPAPTPTGTVIFTLFGPANPTCTGAPIFTSAAIPLVPGAPPTATANSGNFTPTAVGTYNWVAVYSGDGAYPGVTSPCGAPNEASVVGPATPTIVTAALTPVTIGSPINDTATVTGSVPTLVPTGTVTFTLFGPGNPTCTGAPIFTAPTIALAGGPPPTANSGNFTPTAPGTYNWVAVYSGDQNYVSVTSPCGAPNEESVVVQAPIAIATTATPTATLGSSITDVATVTGAAPPAPAPTGTVAFTLFGPADPTCTGAPVFTSPMRPLSGGPPPTATSEPFTPTVAGSYNWVAVYSGDANYPSATSPCGAPNEVSVITPVPTIAVDKTATPLTRPEPGGDFTFNVVVTNTSAEVLTITSLTDDIYGNIATQGTCTTAIGTVLQPSPGPNNTYACSFVGPFMGAAGDFQVDTVTVLAENSRGVEVTDFDDARVDLTDEPPLINIVKDATPLTLPEPGGDFTYNIVVTNPSTIEAVTITELTDSVYGDLSTRGTCTNAIGVVLAINGGSYSCSFTAPFTGSGGDALTDVATVVGVDDDGTEVTDSDDAVVTLTDVLPIIAVLKTATPASLPEPGGTFTFNVVVTNLSPEPVTIRTLTDDVYGNIATQGTCTSAIGTVLAANPGPGNTYSCSFTGVFNGNAGDAQTDTVTATADDDDGNTATADDDAVVTITNLLPTILVEKSASPASRPEPGGSFTFTVVVSNTGPEALTITSLTDDIYGNIATQGTCTTAVGTVLQPGGSYSCSFTGNFTGNAGAAQTDVVTVTGEDDEGNEVTDEDDAIVTITGVPPTVQIVKTATPLSLPEPGGTFTFNFVVTNTSATETITITSLSDDVYGNLNGRGTCAVGAVLAPGATYSCSFSVTFNGQAGASQRDVVIVRAVDDDGEQAVDDDDALIIITDVPPVITLVKTATPLVRNEPGGSFTFDVLITNTGPEAVTITSITDNVYGNLNGRGTCAVGAVLAANGGTYRCSFTGDFIGNAGATQTDIVTATGVDDDGSTTTANDDAVVRLVDVPPTVTVVKDADPISRPEPGGTFTFNITVTNTSFETVTLITLTDDIYGDLNRRGTCAVGASLAPGASYRCSFSAEFRGVAGASQVDRVFATVIDNDGTRATASDDARISLTAVAAPAAQQLSRTGGDVGGPALLAFGLVLVGMLLLGITMRSGGGGALAFAPSGGATWFTGSATGRAWSGLVDGLRTGRGLWTRSPDDDDPDAGLGFHDVDPHDSGPDDSGPDDDEPPSGGPTAGGPPPSGRGPSGGGSGAAAPMAEASADTDRQAPSKAPPAGGSGAAPTESESNSVIIPAGPTVAERAAAIAPAAPRTAAPQPVAPFDISVLPRATVSTPPKPGERVIRLI